MNECNIKGGETIWPEEGDDSGDTMFMMDNNSLIKEIRGAKIKAKRDLFLAELNDPEMIEESIPEDEEVMIVSEPEKTQKIKYEDLDKKNKITYILKQLEKYKSNDL